MAKFVLVKFTDGKNGVAQLIEARDELDARNEGIGILMDDKGYTAQFTTGSVDDDWDLDDDGLHEGVDGDFGDGWMIYPIESQASAPPPPAPSPAQTASILRHTAARIESDPGPDKDRIVRRLSALLNSLK